MTSLQKNFKIRTGKLPQWHCVLPGDSVRTEIKDVYGKTWWCYNEEQTHQAWLWFDKIVGWDDFQMFIPDWDVPGLRTLSDMYI